MNADSSNRPTGSDEADAASRGLAALSTITFDRTDADEILTDASAAVATLAPCRTEASYRTVDNEWVRWPRSQPDRPDIDRLLRESGGDGQIDVPGRGWGWAFALRYQDTLAGCLIVSAADPPGPTHILLLTILAQQTGAALACAEMHHRDAGWSGQLAEANEKLGIAVQHMQGQTNVHDVLGAALAADSGEQGIADALHGVTGLPVAVEDRFGNLRCWAGPGRPRHYPKSTADRRDELLHRLGTFGGPVRLGGRTSVLVKPRAEILGVVTLIAHDEQVTDDQLFALGYGSTVLGFELSHRRNIAEMALNLRRELVNDLLAGTDEDGAYARAEALGHDLRRPHYVVVVHGSGAAGAKLATEAARATSALRLNFLEGRQAGLVVLLIDDRPDPRALHRALSQRLGTSTSAIGIGSRCEAPADFPHSFAKARRALNIRLHSASPGGASAYDELGFYRLIDAAHGAGAVDDFVQEWLGVLIEYDDSRSSQLVHTLSEYLECGGNYHESATSLHIHRSTLRYRLARIGELTGYDLRNVDTRFNLHAATRSWRFLNPGG
jgi:hypothetical protein